MKRVGVVCILILAFLGIADSAYLATQEANGNPLLCDLGEKLSGCNTVVASEYSHLFGISLANFGLLFYTILFVLASFELLLFNQMLRRALQAFSIIGLCVSLYSVYTQVFIIKATCIYCLASALITLLVLLIASAIEPLSIKKSPSLSDTSTV